MSGNVMSGHLKTQIEDLRHITDAFSEISDDLEIGIASSSEVIMGRLMINGKEHQITLKAESNQNEWISD